MTPLYEDEEIPVALVRRRPAREAVVTHDEADEQPLAPSDRMGVGTSGGIAGLFAGGAALGVVHWLTPSSLNGPILRAAGLWGVEPLVSLVVAYATAAAIGAL